MYQIRSVAENQIYRLKMQLKANPSIGLSTVKEYSQDSSGQASIFDVHEHHDFSDTETVFSTYQQDYQSDIEFIQL